MALSASATGPQIPLIGYARVSTKDQTGLPQVQALRAAGCVNIHAEQAALNEHSVEAKVRSILIEAVRATHAGVFGQRLRQHFKGVLGNHRSMLRNQTASGPDLFQ